MHKHISYSAKINNMFKPFLIVSCLIWALILSLLLPIPVLAEVESSSANNLSEYQRKYISLYQQKNNPLDEFLSRYFQRELPRFDYVLQGLNTQISLPDFLNRVKTYQSEHAGEFAAGQELADLKLGEQVVTWSETLKLLNAAYVMAPEWSFSPIVIGGPEKPKNSELWYLSFRSQLTLNLPIYTLKQVEPQVLEAYSQNWEIIQLLPIENLDSLRERMQNELGSAPQVTDGKAFLEQLRKLTPFDRVFARLEQDDPAASLSGVAVKALEAELQPEAQLSKISDQILNLGLGQISLFNPNAVGQVSKLLEGVSSLYKLQELVAKLRNNPDFAVRGQVITHDLDTNRVKLSLPKAESAQSLGLHLDHGYKIIEYRENQTNPSEIGFIKLRQLNEKELLAEPIIQARTFELGDQYLEYAKTDWLFSLKGGIGSLMLDPRLGPQDFQPEGVAEISYSLASVLNWSETYFNLVGSLGQLSQGVGANQDDLFALTTEVGLSKRIYFHQWILNLGLRVGLMNGQLSRGERKLSQSNFGGTLLGGLAYQFNPDLIFGVDAGWRYFPSSSNKWDEGDQSVTLGYGLESNGPVLSVFFNYQI
jgi:hypothetical protein